MPQGLSYFERLMKLPGARPVPKEQVKAFTDSVESEVIPQILEEQRRQAVLVAEARREVYWSPELLRVKEKLKRKVDRLKEMGLLQPGVRLPKGGLSAIIRLM